MLKKKLGKQLKNTTTINLIESLFIIQRTQPKPSDNNTFRTSSMELALSTKLQLQEKQKEQHDNQLSNKPVEFKIENKVLLHYTKAEKQWSRKFDPK
ncbi:hypothetical protein G9A89_004331 [Geosiphon pyriformis]|nr:hypothetical protein G9A89_004331 [Geosiphon pyriformis]